MKSINIIFIFFILLLKADSFFAQESFNFNEKFQRLAIRHDLNIFKKNQSDYFYLTLTSCLPDFYKNIKTSTYYFLRGHEKSNAIVVVEYIFDNNSSAKASYDLIYEYAEIARKRPFIDYSDICLIRVQMHERIYYSILKDNHLYLFGWDHDFALYGNNSIETLIKSNNTVLIDDLINQFNKL